MRILLFFILIFNLYADDLNISQPIIVAADYNVTDTQHIVEVPDNYDSEKIDIAILINKDKFFKFIPSLLNSVNAYMLKQDINYHIKLFNLDKNITKTLNKVTPNYDYIFVYLTDPNQTKILTKYDNDFFIPTLNKNQTDINQSNTNIFFGGIDYKKQISKLDEYVVGKKISIYDKSILSKSIASEINDAKQIKYPFYYKRNDLNKSFVFLNTKVVNTAQILANFTYYDIKPNLLLSTQINYSPLLFSLTNPEDTTNLIIANSILNINPIIESNNIILNSDINYNWLNYTTSVLLNKVYSLENDEDSYYLNDFDLYMFYNQVEYKTNIYKIYKRGFIPIEE